MDVEGSRRARLNFLRRYSIICLEGLGKTTKNLRVKHEASWIKTIGAKNYTKTVGFWNIGYALMNSSEIFSQNGS
jgi:hypothetical protein